MASRMYADVARENNRWARVMVGVIQKAKSQPTYNGCRTTRYGPGVPKGNAEYGRPSRYSHTWRRPNRSKWLIRNVDTRTRAQPKANSDRRISRPIGSSTDQTMPPIGCHSKKSRIKARLENRT